jgi:hypothetical protein
MDAKYTLDAMIAGLVGAGYHVSFTEGFGAEPFGAHVEFPGDPEAGCTALGYTPALALAAALPETVAESLAALPAPAVADDLRTINADIEDFNDRLNTLEARHDKFDRVEAALVHVMVELLLKSDPDGELARHFAGKRAAEKAADAG